MLTDHHGREMVYYGELALDEHGKILALRAKSLFQLGAYFVGAALAAGAFSMRFIPAAYDIQTMHIMSQGLFTNTSQSGPYRGAGRPEAAYFMERLIEHAARTTGIDPAEIRRRNLIPPDKLPYTTPTLWTYDSGEFDRLMDLCIENSDWKGYAARKKASKKHGKLRGRAVCFYIEFGGIFNDRMDLHFDPDGTLTISAAPIRTARATPRCSRSSRTSCSACRSNRSATCRATPRRSRSAAAPMARAAWWSAATRSRRRAMPSSRRAKLIAAAMMEADAADLEFKDGQFRVVGTDKVDQHRRRRQGDLCADGTAHRASSASASMRPAASARRRRAIRTARMCASSRSIRRPARWWSTAISSSTTSAASSIR